MMEESVKSKKMEDLLSLRGTISIDYDWQREEEAELKATKNRELLHGTTVRSHHSGVCHG